MWEQNETGVGKVRGAVLTGLGWLWVGLVAPTSAVLGAAELPTDGATVAVVYNVRQPGSEALAYYYAQRRAVPTNQVLGLELPTGESMSRREFRQDLQAPLLGWLDRERLLVLRTPARHNAEKDTIGSVSNQVVSARIRYVVLCYGVPVKIAPDPGWSEPGMESIPPVWRRNEATVESELAWLPLFPDAPVLTGAGGNPVFGQTDMDAVGPRSGVLMVSRLDGPSVEVARRLVDQAMEAERNGLWGRAYVDLRGLTNSHYLLGEQWLQGAAGFLQKAGYETVVDTNAATFGRGFPMSQIAFYAGWYDREVSGPFTVLPVEFMPGAFAYHLHSFSAHVLRTPSQYWVGPLLDRGATVSVGYAEEPYLQATLDLNAFSARWIQGGFSFGEAVYASLPALSWQTTVVGDPLYRPFGRSPRSDPLGLRFRDLHLRLGATTNALLEWSHLQVINLSLLNDVGTDYAGLREYLSENSAVLRSPVLAEKLGDMELRKGRVESAIQAYGLSIGYGGSRQQRLRVLLGLSTLQELSNDEAGALRTCQQVLEAYPEYPDRIAILQKALTLARELERTELVTQLEEALGYQGAVPSE